MRVDNAKELRQTSLMQPRAIVLVSGGLDSATTLALAQAQGYALYAMSFAYGQRQSVELEAAAQVVQAFACQQHRIVKIDLATFGGSALTSDFEVPKGATFGQAPKASSQEGQSSIPITYVPARNTIFLSYALAWAEVLQAENIFIGVNAVDYSGYPDCRPEFIQSFEDMANLATRIVETPGKRLRIQAPLLHWSKKEIIECGTRLGVDYRLTHSCYDPVDGKACGRCDACVLRHQGFVQAKLDDPTIYAARPA